MTDNNLDNQNLDNQNPNNQNTPKTYTQEELDKLLQTEADKRVSQALSTARSKFEDELKEKIAKEKSEAEKLSRMNEEERFKIELQKQQQAFEEEKKQFQRERMELETTKELAKLNLPTQFAKYLLDDKSEVVAENIKNFKTEWENAIQKEVESKLQGTTPKTSTTTSPKVTKEEFKKFNYHQRMELYEKDKALYDQLAN